MFFSPFLPSTESCILLCFTHLSQFPTDSSLHSTYLFFYTLYCTWLSPYFTYLFFLHILLNFFFFISYSFYSFFLLVDRVIQKKRRDYSDSNSSNNMKRLNDDLNNIQDIMRKTIDDVLDR